MSRKITVIHPSRNRGALAVKAARMFIDNAKEPINYVFALDNDDTHIPIYTGSKIDCLIINNEKNTAIYAINKAAQLLDFDILMVVSDDFICEPAWDVKLKEFIKDQSNFVLKTNDGMQEWIVTLPIMDKAYYDTQGYVYHPDYRHLFCDTEMTHVADITGRLLVNKNINFIHLWTKVTGDDEINKKNNASYGQGEKLYLEREKVNFNLPADMIKRQITCPTHINWIKNRRPL